MGLRGKGGLLCPSSRPRSQNPQGVGPGNLPFKTSFPATIPFARSHPHTQEDLVIFPLVQNPGWNSTNPKLKLKNSTPDATCCFSESQTLEEIHSACHVFSSLRAPVGIWNCGSTSVSSVLGLIPHLKSCSSLCDNRRRLRPRRWQEAPKQQGVLAPGRGDWRRRDEESEGAVRCWPCRPGTGTATARTYAPCLAAPGAEKQHICTTSLLTGNGLHGFSDFTLPRLERAVTGEGDKDHM